VSPDRGARCHGVNRGQGSADSSRGRWDTLKVGLDYSTARWRYSNVPFWLFSDTAGSYNKSWRADAAGIDEAARMPAGRSHFRFPAPRQGLGGGGGNWKKRDPGSLCPAAIQVLHLPARQSEHPLRGFRYSAMS